MGAIWTTKAFLQMTLPATVVRFFARSALLA